ncbi:TRAP transporter fused permease subunit [Nonomuraea sp. NPDC050790]|uniref:TRAP transporter fused permease subunit n=1 Tax=Nonomuraea sp. NPDC050790 TaxID=3364371 RepID=UPI0037AFAE1C
MAQDVVVPEAAKLEQIGEIDTGQVRKLPRGLNFGLGVWACLIGLLVLWQVFFPLSQGNQYYLVIFLGLSLPLVFLYYRPARHRRTTPEGLPAADTPTVRDWVLAVLLLLVGLYPVLPLPIGAGGFDAFLDRQGILSAPDVVAGAALLLLVLGAAFRTSGLMLPLVCVLFVGYSYYGGYLPADWDIAHAGVDFDQIINGLYNNASGFYGTPLDVAATYILLFTIYGAVLDASGASTFFVNISLSTFRRSRTAPGRTAIMSGFLLGSVSGSGAATTLSVGTVTWPILRRAGYTKENAGGLLAASGIGATLSPPTLGAAAFIIAEYLNTSYFDVLVWAIVPTLLYYLGILLAVEADARKFGARSVAVSAENPWRLLRRGGYHFASLGIIVAFLAMDLPPFLAVVNATAAAAVFGLVAKLVERGQTPLGAAIEWLRSLLRALAAGIHGALPAVAVCAAAGVIASTVTKTGLGHVLSSSLVEAARTLADDPTAVLVLTVVFSVVALGVLGLAVPVVASFVIAWVTLAPALTDLGVSPIQTAMFLFYYAVLSDVTPPTALASAVASAVTGGAVNQTMWQTWKYALPAFLVPMAFVLTDTGSALLWQRPPLEVLWATAVSALGVVALAVVTSGWMVGPAQWLERALCVPAAALLLYLQPASIAVGAAFFLAAVVIHLATRPRRHMSDPPASDAPEPGVPEPAESEPAEPEPVELVPVKPEPVEPEPVKPKSIKPETA